MANRNRNIIKENRPITSELQVSCVMDITCNFVIYWLEFCYIDFLAPKVRRQSVKSEHLHHMIAWWRALSKHNSSCYAEVCQHVDNNITLVFWLLACTRLVESGLCYAVWSLLALVNWIRTPYAAEWFNLMCSRIRSVFLVAFKSECFILISMWFSSIRELMNPLNAGNSFHLLSERRTCWLFVGVQEFLQKP